MDAFQFTDNKEKKKLWSAIIVIAGIATLIPLIYKIIYDS